MFARLSGDLCIAHGSKRVIEIRTALLVPALHGAAVCGNATEAGRHPLHRLLVERQEVVPPVVLGLGATIGDAAGRDEHGPDLARVHRVVEDGRAEEDGVAAVAVVAGRVFGVGRGGKWRGGAECDAVAGRGRGSRGGVGRRRRRRIDRVLLVRVFVVVQLHLGK